ncbi:aminodeoxychorismate/anthranilate synthase component II [Bradyrhizobium sp. CNPSo 4010]|uniref:Aminodeoxychorismate/anthranilate synthase component II n=1 Tax=Bradyrhizobium agreste TaxID=2751811 RepID=A0ABS0PQ43_9BRAD|nr:aminodeoxychorismate/anthranilate synthase component II [Bradyrhizobium agreste]MBH5399017.1 aminodeoxychorismate/anthranilate synthase component II [Bradyrhizobium agreste]
MILIDNFDSFTFNIAQMVGEVNGREVIVLDNTVPWSEIRKIPHDRIILSPGPGSPQNSEDVGSTMDVLAGSAVPVLGVCLGHQCIAYFHGASVARAPEPLHGRIRSITTSGTGLFEGLPRSFNVTRYHSLAVTSDLPECLECTAMCEDGVIMGLRHRQAPHYGVQFHPESICSQYGRELFANFLSDLCASSAAPSPLRAMAGA